MRRTSDDELVRRAQRGAPRAFDELVERHWRSVYQLALRVTANPHDAEEIVQDTLLLVHRGLASFRGEAKFSTWLYSVTRNAALMHLRHWRKLDVAGVDKLAGGDQASAGDDEDSLARRQLARTAMSELSALPDEYRVPFMLRDLEGLSSRETAAAVGINVNLVRQRVFRARRMLRRRLYAYV
jgi:RNA polymerase sigma-70 factor (ECF subfamily)